MLLGLSLVNWVILFRWSLLEKEKHLVNLPKKKLMANNFIVRTTKHKLIYKCGPCSSKLQCSGALATYGK